MSRHIAFYGKAGAGKSTIATAVAAALSGAGRRILLVGCDPHSESTLLLRGERAPALVELLEDGKDAMERAVTVGFNGVRCIELGNLFRAGGCAGTAIYTAFSAIYDSEAYR
ncbi:MAG TPA: ArsA-related P-loop ATPase, partial [Verrucomicrobiae bacterium]|nr:ArsA-related P-loop ATPase [Verrucomicrobiae bacterium]